MNRCARLSQVLLAVTLPLSGAAPPDPYRTQWQDVQKRQPAGVTFVVTAPKLVFFRGELIPLQLSFSSAQPQGYLADSRLYDRVGRMNYTEEFRVDATTVEDPLQGLPGSDGGMGGLSGGPVILSGKPFVVERTLNEWVRFRKPGTYRVYVLSRRVSRITEPGHSDSYQRLYARGAPVELVSNILTLTIRAAPAAWVKEQITAATRILDAPESFEEQAAQLRRQAGSRLRFLDTLEASIELAKRLGPGADIASYSLHMGVLGSPFRKQLLPLLEERLVAADQPVWDRSLDTLAQLAVLVAAGGPMPAFPKEESQRKTWLEESKRRRDLAEQKRNEYSSRLIASLPSKQPQARAVALNTLLNSALQTGAQPPWLNDIVTSLIADFRNLPSTTQSDLLENRWSAIKGPAMLPILRQTYASPPLPRVDPPLEDVALRRLFDLAPGEARQIILDEIRQPTKGLRFATLAMLPERHLPEVNDALVARLQRGDYPDQLILRYGTGDIVQQVEKAYLKRRAALDQQKLPHCSSPLVFYFLHYDPAFGERELRRNLSTEGGYPACYDIGFQFLGLGRYAFSPALERLAIEYLSSPAVPVKRGAAEVLGKYGSTAAQKPLWETMEYFRSWWKGREGQLKETVGQESMQFERVLRIALAQADGWVLRERDLERLLALCSSDWCKQEVGGWLQQAKPPLPIQILPGIDGFSIGVAQYAANSDEQLRRKLAQFPAGTTFRIASFAEEDGVPGLKQARLNIEQAVRAGGHTLAP